MRFLARKSIWLLPSLLLIGDVPAFAQRLGQGNDDGVAWWRVVAALILCLALAAAAAVVIKIRLHGRLPSPRSFLWGTMQQDRRLKLIETLKVSEHIDVCIIACDGKELLVAASQQRADLLERLPFDDARPTGAGA